MPPTKQQNFRLDESLWAAFGDAAQSMRTTRSKVLTEFIAWYLHLPHSRPPVRPEFDTKSR